MIPESWAIWLERAFLASCVAIGLLALSSREQSELASAALGQVALFGFAVGLATGLVPRRWGRHMAIRIVLAVAGCSALMWGFYQILGPPAFDSRFQMWPDFGLVVGALALGVATGETARFLVARGKQSPAKAEIDLPPT